MHHSHFKDKSGQRKPDRRLIRVEPEATQQGIVSALRRAFLAISCPANDEEFERLLERIH